MTKRNLTKPAQELLHLAAEIAGKLGHHKNSMTRERWTDVVSGRAVPTACCTLGAIGLAALKVTCDGFTERRAIDRLHDYLRPRPDFESIAEWNDRPETTREDVVAALIAAAQENDA